MRIWNVGSEDVKQMYNSKIYFVSANKIIDVSDELGGFLLSKPEIKGKGLVQVKDGDLKEEKYKEARLHIYDRANRIYEDYQRHCEERGEINKAHLKPHKEILDAKNLIDEYEKWLNDGEPIPQDIKEEKIGETKVYMCPVCNKEFKERVAYFGHMRSHEKEKNDVSAVSNESQGKSR